MQKHGFGRRLRMVAVVMCGVLAFSPPVRNLATAPGLVELPLGQRIKLSLGLGVRAMAVSSDQRVVEVEPEEANASSDIAVKSHHLGEATLHTRLFGWIPWRSVRVHVVPEQKVYVGGQSIGVNLRANGVIVVGFQTVDGERSPAARARLQVGDVIEEADGKAVHGSEDLVERVKSSKGPVHLRLRRRENHVQVDITPLRDEAGIHHLGLYVRDRAAGVGTLTFYEPLHHRFGALGHVITDADTGQPIEGTGAVFAADVIGMVKGRAGQPGEKRGRFSVSEGALGQIEENTSFGVFGSMKQIPPDSLFLRELPVATPLQVHNGPAQMLTVLQGRSVKVFRVQIESCSNQVHPATKSMVIKVTDPRLLRASGGIVQGMSGSPLVQDGRLIGAVTHVFVSDPTRGYGVYAQWMLREAEGENMLMVKSNFVESALWTAKSIQSIWAGHTLGSSNWLEHD